MAVFDLSFSEKVRLAGRVELNVFNFLGADQVYYLAYLKSANGNPTLHG